MTPASTVEVDAHAKVNLFLRVLGLRPDGYHDLQTLVAPVSLADRLRVSAFADPGTLRTMPPSLTLSLEVVGEPAPTRGVPVDDTNLVLRAARELARAAGVMGFAEIVLDKRIPSAAGLGGGSADAAATLLVLNERWSCGLGAEALRDVGARIGSDVPALLHGGPVVATGRGETISPAAVGAFGWVLITFGFGVNTKEAFGWWDDDGMASGPDPAPVIEAAAGGEPEALGPLLFNDLEGPVMRRHPQIREAKDRLLDAGLPGAVMCGSGTSVAGLLPAGRPVPDPTVEAELARLSGRPPRYVTTLDARV